MTLPQHGHTCHLNADAGKEERPWCRPLARKRDARLFFPQLQCCCYCFESSRDAVAVVARQQPVRGPPVGAPADPVPRNSRRYHTLIFKRRSDHHTCTQHVIHTTYNRRIKKLKTILYKTKNILILTLTIIKYMKTIAKFLKLYSSKGRLTQAPYAKH